MRYSSEKNTLLLIALMKEHGIKRVIVSPGTTNVALVASLQGDDYFELYSAYDERSAAYMACGMAVESGEPVALSCTQATASRNYLSGLTEAFYRKIPILAITSTQHIGRIGQNYQQAIDRSTYPNDAVQLSVHIPVINNNEDEWYCNVLINKAFLELKRNGGGPVHINLTTTYSRNFDSKELPNVRKMIRVNYFDFYKSREPNISTGLKIVIFVGNHKKWDENLTTLVDLFCEKYNSVVLCDQTSNYKGKYRVNPCLLLYQTEYKSYLRKIDIMIYIGDVSGAPIDYEINEVWRVNPDGEPRDLFKKAKYIFEMEEEYFFHNYVCKTKDTLIEETNYYEEWQKECSRLRDMIPELPFSNAWIAKNTIGLLPSNSILHLGIYNTLRHWSFFEAPQSVLAYSNTGGFGIDGCLSSAIGASNCCDDLVFLVLGDLAFFYDLNSLGNRHVRGNLRILLINNGLGTEFKNPDNRAYGLEDKANMYIAAEGHNGNKSKDLVRHYSEDLGYKYLSAENKEEFKLHINEFIDEKECLKPIIFEVFIESKDETDALKILMSIEKNAIFSIKKGIKNVIGEKGTNIIKNFMR